MGTIRWRPPPPDLLDRWSFRFAMAALVVIVVASGLWL